MPSHEPKDDIEHNEHIDLERGVTRLDTNHSYDGPYLADGQRNGSALSKTVSIDADLFERLYLQPKNEVSGDLRKTFANPTPLALLGFSVGLLPLTTAYMGWRGAGGNGVATTASTIWFGGMLLVIAGVMEWILGNFFPFIVFMGYGCHFLTIGTTFMPFYNAVAAFNADGSQQITAEFAASFGFYPLVLAMLSLAFLLGSIRTNVVFVLIFINATIGFGMAAGAFWYIAEGHMAYGTKLLKGTGGCFFVASLLGWYLFFGSIIATMELPMPDLPVFDLSTVIKPRKRGAIAKTTKQKE